MFFHCTYDTKQQGLIVMYTVAFPHIDLSFVNYLLEVIKINLLGFCSYGLAHSRLIKGIELLWNKQLLPSPLIFRISAID